MGQKPHTAARRQVTRPVGLASMTDPAEPIVVSANAGGIDAVQAALRYTVFLITALVALAGFVRVRDVAGAVVYLQTNGGQLVAALAGLIALGTSAYGVLKTHKRGAQVATVAADRRVPDAVATLK